MVPCIVSLTLLGVAAVSRRLTGTPVTPAIVFVAVGLLLHTAVAVPLRLLGIGLPLTIALGAVAAAASSAS
jgi:hypothetical protein